MREKFAQFCVIFLLATTMSASAQAQNEPKQPSTQNGQDGQAGAEPGFSKNFMQAGIQTTSAIKTWRSRLAYGVRHAYPGDGSGLTPFHDRAAENLRLATAAATNDSDQSGLQLLTNHFNNVDQWAGQMIAARQSMDASISMSPDALDNDPLFQKIKACADFLPSMLASGKFTDNPSCH